LQVEKAKKLVSVFSNAHGNACEVDGKMVDIPVFRSAQRILKLAKISI
jgi:(S)-citramalyl-CoA lyase